MQSTGLEHTLRLLSEGSASYALLCRSEAAGGREVVELILGDFQEVDLIGDIRLDQRALVALPFRQATERGFACNDDGCRIRILVETSSATFDRSDFVAAGAGSLSVAEPMTFTTDDSKYEDLVAAVIQDEIGVGECSNVVVSRRLRGRFASPAPRASLRLFCNLLAIEAGFYWAFLLRTPGLTLVGATPEQHVRLEAGELSMTAISGTARLSSNDAASVLQLLGDQKERYELCMVVDEELKMLSRCSSSAPRVVGPHLRFMRKVVHTEYELYCASQMQATEALRETMFAPTVVGSPLENAFRVIERRERAPRSYYSGLVALLEPGNRVLDSAITIRTCEITDDSVATFTVGSTITRDSVPAKESEEARAKSAAFLAAVLYEPDGQPASQRPASPAADSELEGLIESTLSKQASRLSRFWMQPRRGARSRRPVLLDTSVLIIDFEDHFVHMWARILEELGAQVNIRTHFAQQVPGSTPNADVVILGPGPGDPLAFTETRQSCVLSLLETLVSNRRPIVAVCLAHQILCAKLGLPVRRRTLPNQGLQRPTSWRGRAELVGFYNTFEAHLTSHYPPQLSFELSDDGAIDSMTLPGVASMQFHPESILTTNGDVLIAESVMHALGSNYRRAD